MVAQPTTMSTRATRLSASMPCTPSSDPPIVPRTMTAASFRSILPSRLCLRAADDSLDELLRLARECGADCVVWNRRYEPASVARDRQIKLQLRASGLATSSHNSALLFEPWEVKSKSGGPFQVFTPYWRACLAQAAPALPLPAPQRLRAPQAWPASARLEELALLPRVDWSGGLRRTWMPGGPGACSRLQAFLGESLRSYGQRRNRPDAAGTSRLSPHLHFGEIGPREIWHAARETGLSQGGDSSWRQSQFITELGWREFAYHLLFHFPQTPDAPLRGNFARFPWRDDAPRLRAWQRGHTALAIHSQSGPARHGRNVRRAHPNAQAAQPRSRHCEPTPQPRRPATPRRRRSVPRSRGGCG